MASPCTARIAPAPTRACGYATSRSLFCAAIVPSIIYGYSIGPNTTRPCGSATSRSLFWHSFLIPRKTKHKSFLLVTALITWLACLPIMRTCYYTCANSVLNAQLRPGFPTLTLFNVLNVIYTPCSRILTRIKIVGA